MISDEHRKRLFSGKNGVFPGTVLVDGFVAGTWELIGKGESTSMRVLPHVRLKRSVLNEIDVEGNRLVERAFGVFHPTETIHSLAASRRLRKRLASARKTPRAA